LTGSDSDRKTKPRRSAWSTDGMVEITRLPSAKMAVMAYKGTWREGDYPVQVERLMALLAGTRWTLGGSQFGEGTTRLSGHLSCVSTKSWCL
jgi:hypothetical protein